MKYLKTAILCVSLAVGMFTFGSVHANPYAVQNCSWVTTSSSYDGWYMRTSQAYRCTLVQNGNQVTPLTRNIEQQTRSMGGPVPPPSCNIQAHGVYSYTGTCWSPTLVVPQQPSSSSSSSSSGSSSSSSSGGCGPNAGQMWGTAIMANLTQSDFNSINAYCGSCGFNAQPIPGSYPVQHVIRCNY